MSLDAPIPRTLRGAVDARSQSAVGDALRSIAGMFDRPVAEASISLGEEAANVRRVRIRVLDRLGEPWPACWPVRVWISTTAGGPPSGVQTLALVTGTSAAAVQATKDEEFYTDATGLLELDLGVSGAGTRYVRAFITGVPPAATAAVFA